MAAPTDPLGFFNWLIKGGVITGSAAHYTTKGALQPWEFNHAIQVAQQAAQASFSGVEGYDPNFGKEFYTALHKMGAIKGDLSYFTSGDVMADPTTLADVVQKAGDFFATRAQTGPAAPDGPAQGVPTLSILSSPRLRWQYDSRSKLYYASYQIPGTQHRVLFEANEQQIKEIFGEGNRPPNLGSIDFNKAVRDPLNSFGGDIAEMEGKGSFEQHFNRTVSLALDQRDLPDWIKKDPQALGLVFMLTTEGRTNDWFYDQLSNLASFKKRYPGMDKMLGDGVSVVEAVKAFDEYEQGLKKLHAAAGFNPSAISHQLTGNLINKGYSLNQVQETYSTWKRIHSNSTALKAFNEILVASGHAALQGKSMYAFLQGNAPQELYDMWEASAINEAAEATGFGSVFGGSDALKLALQREETITQDQAFASFQKVAQQALRFRHELNLGQYGLDVDDLIDLSFGQKPRSGKDMATVSESMMRIQQEAQGFIAGRVNPFISFTDKGRPKAVSFGEARQVT